MKKIVILLALAYSIKSQSQVAINTDGTNPNPNAMLDIKSNNKGVLLSRMSTAQRKSIVVQASDAGLLVFDTDQQTLFMYDGTKWMPISFSSPDNIAPVNRSPIIPLNGGHNFGNVVAISGNYAFISSGLNSQDDQGSVYVFERGPAGWTQQAKLTASDASADRHFGSSIAVHGDYAVIGINPIGITIGAAYVFKRNGSTWIEQVKLTAPGAVQGDFFGSSVAITTDMILVGASGKDFSGLTNIGCVYVYKRSGSNWNYSGEFFANATINQDRFGETIAMHGNYAVVGIPNRTVTGFTQAGIAQVFFYNGNNWTYQSTLMPVSANTNSRFGRSVAIYGDRVVVGQPGLTVSGKPGVGRASLYKRTGTTWNNAQTFWIDNGEENDSYGLSVAINNEFVLIGAPQKTDAGFLQVGLVYAYKNTNNVSYDFQRIIKDVNGGAALNFAKSVAIDELLNTYIIGIPGKNNYAGAVGFGLIE